MILKVVCKMLNEKSRLYSITPFKKKKKLVYIYIPTKRKTKRKAGHYNVSDYLG